MQTIPYDIYTNTYDSDLSDNETDIVIKFDEEINHNYSFLLIKDRIQHSRIDELDFEEDYWSE